MGSPWLITLDDEGNMTEYDDFTPESIGLAQGIVADHRNHSIFAVSDCPQCQEAS